MNGTATTSYTGFLNLVSYKHLYTLYRQVRLSHLYTE